MDRQDLMNKYIGLVRAMAWKIHRKLPRHVDVEELVAYGHLGLAEAARSFDPGRGLKFSTFAFYRIRGAIFDGLQEMNWFRVADYHAGEYEEQDETPKEAPADSPPASAPRLSPAKRKSRVLSLTQLEADQGDTVADRSAAAPGSRMEQRELEQQLWALIDTLPAQMATLLRWTYCDGMTLKEAGEKLGHTKSWASRLHASALARLAKGMGAGDS